jgi:RimJ/RimL family protein N-acetyltransferase
VRTTDVTLREVQPDDLAVFFEQQADPEAQRRADFPGRDRDAFLVHWARCLANPAGIHRTILFAGQVAGNVVSWEQAGERRIGYWLGRSFWGQGIATAALSLFVEEVSVRPLHAHVARTNGASIRVLQKCGFTTRGEDTFPSPDGEPGQELIMVLEARMTES